MRNELRPAIWVCPRIFPDFSEVNYNLRCIKLLDLSKSISEKEPFLMRKYRNNFLFFDNLHLEYWNSKFSLSLLTNRYNYLYFFINKNFGLSPRVHFLNFSQVQSFILPYFRAEAASLVDKSPHCVRRTTKKRFAAREAMLRGDGGNGRERRRK